MISKKEFIDFIDTFKKYNDFEKTVQDVSKHSIRFYDMDPLQHLLSKITSILEGTFNSEDDWIDYYIYELDFGKKYEPGSVHDINGKDIPFKTPEDLYNLLINNYNKKERLSN